MQTVTKRATRRKRQRSGPLGMFGFSAAIAGIMIAGAWDTTDTYNALLQFALLIALISSHAWAYFWGRGWQKELIAAAQVRLTSRATSAAALEPCDTVQEADYPA